jgi:hypothetical protein
MKSTHSPEVKQRIAALKAIAGDGRRTRQVRDTALRELKTLKAAKQRTQRGDSVVTMVSPASAPQSRVMPAPVSILDDPKPPQGLEDPAPEPDSGDTDRPDRRQRLLAFKEHLLATDNDPDKLSWIEEQLLEMDKPEPVRVSEPEKPTEKSGYQKLREYFYGPEPESTSQSIKVDFAGSGIPEQGNPDWYWDKQFPRESVPRALAAKRIRGAGRQVGKGWWEDW